VAIRTKYIRENSRPASARSGSVSGTEAAVSYHSACALKQGNEEKAANETNIPYCCCAYAAGPGGCDGCVLAMYSQFQRLFDDECKQNRKLPRPGRLFPTPTVQIFPLCPFTFCGVDSVKVPPRNVLRMSLPSFSAPRPIRTSKVNVKSFLQISEFSSTLSLFLARRGNHRFTSIYPSPWLDVRRSLHQQVCGRFR
jgi:hypothetical protein